jgi:hypothetical protein
MTMSTEVASVQRVLPDTVHKEHEEDVLVCNARGCLPTWISEDLLADPGLDEADRAMLNRFYRRHEAITSGVPAKRLYLRSLPAGIDRSRLPELEPADQALVLQHYAGEGDWMMLVSPFVDEVDEARLMQALVARECHIGDNDRAAVDRVFASLPHLERPRRLYLNLLIDTRHYFFFRRHQEHVPGLMLIEAARQAMYAHYHHYSAWTRAQAAFTIESLDVDFHGFTNPNYPVRIRVEDAAPSRERSTGEEAQRSASFYQLNRLTAVAKLRAKVIKSDLFKRLRNIAPQSGSQRFVPVKNIARTTSFCTARGHRMEGSVRDLSMDGLGAEFAADDADLAIGSSLVALLHVESLGYISADLALRWKQSRGERMAAGFEIVRMDLPNERRLREAIKNYCFLDTRRTAL